MDQEKKRPGISPQTIYNVVMGLFWTGLGLAFLFHKPLGLSFGARLENDPVLTNIFGVAAVLYGGFRFYRGYAFSKNRS